MVQLKFNWTVIEGLLASDQLQFDNVDCFYLKDNETFYNA